MKNLCKHFVPALALLVLSSCGGDESTRTDAAVEESAFDPMVSTIDKAKGVENLSADRTEELDKEIEKAQ